MRVFQFVVYTLYRYINLMKGKLIMEKSSNKLVNLSVAFAVEILNLVKFLKSQHETIICNQIGRAGTSIGANIHEAQYAHGKADFISKLQIALKEANETSIRHFKLENGIATFTVYNKSGWHSGTRLPASWTKAIKEKTSYEIFDLVTDAPRGEVIKTKIEKYFPEASKISGSGYILKLLPSYGGDWEQYYEIRMEWKK